MIVTADPLGDFNATSQILRYSALAREVTVPRIPSVSSTILAGVPSRVPSGHTSPSAIANGMQVDEGVVEMAFSEIARLNEEVELLNLRLAEEERRRREAEGNWQRAEDKAEGIEMEVREECWGEMEQRLEEERRRWKGAWGEEADRNDEHLDRKLDILSKSINVRVREDPVDEIAYRDQLERENEGLRYKIEALEREAWCRSPTHTPTTAAAAAAAATRRSLGKASKPMQNLDTSRDVLGSSAAFSLNRMSLTEPADEEGELEGEKALGTAKKMRKLTARKWDLMDESELEALENCLGN